MCDADLSLSNGSSTIAGVPFTPGTGWHPYRLSVKGNTITASVNGHPVLSATDNLYLAPGAVGLFSDATQISVRSFSVTTP